MARPIGLWIGCAVVVSVSLGWLGCVLVAILALVLTLPGRKQDALIACIVLVAGLIGSIRAGSSTVSGVPETLWQSTGAELTITGFPRASANSTMVRARVEMLLINGEMIDSQPVQVWLSLDPGVSIAPGARIRVAWTPQSLAATSPGYARWVESQGAQLLARAWSVSEIAKANRVSRWIVHLQFRVTDNLEQILPGDAGALAAGIVTGDDSALSEAAVGAFQRTGTTHITAVSGSNVAVVLAIWYAVVPPGPLRRRRTVRLVIIATIWLYALGVGFEPPAIRAALMTTGALIGANAGRRPDPMTLLAIASATIAFVFPASVHQVSYWLSVVASMAIISRVHLERSGSSRDTILDLISGVVMAQVCTLPITLLVFGSWSLTGIAANLVMAPIMALAFPLCFGLACISIVVPPLASVLAPFVGVLLDFALAFVESVSNSSPSLALGESGPLAIVAIGVPCLLIAALMSRDVQRWVRHVLPVFD